MKKIINFIKVQKYLLLILVSITIFVVATSIKIHEKAKANLEAQTRAIEVKKPVKENLAIEVGSIIPKISDYFNDEKAIPENASINYYLDGEEVKEEDICKMQMMNKQARNSPIFLCGL